MRTACSLIIVLFFTVLFHFSCKEDVVPPKTDNDPGILRTDEFGNILGGDSTDWCWRGASNGFSFGPAYPNPVLGNVFSIRFFSIGAEIVKMYFLRSNTDTLVVVNDTTLNPGTYGYIINVSGYGFTNSFRRLYIKTGSFISSDSCKNYGDIKFEE